MKTYIISKMPKSVCPKCDDNVWWLAPLQVDNSDPTFFLCVTCGYIGQVGVGPVETKEASDVIP